MTSLSDVYAGGVGTATDRRRRLLGAGLFAVGAAMIVGAIPIATTDVAGQLGLGVYGARELAGVLAGLGLPAAFVGIFTVLPGGRATRAAATIGASVAVFGVAVFAAAYPYNWISNAPTLAVATVVIYSVGTLVTFWCLFVGLATFKRRNDPGGSARIEITDEGTVRVVADDGGGLPGFGSVGLFGSDPDGEVETQTNRADDRGSDQPTAGSGGTHDDATILKGSSSAPDRTQERRDGNRASGNRNQVSGNGNKVSGNGNRATPASDGAGAIQPSDDPSPARQDPAGADADVRAAVRHRGRPDEYCGNCRHFEYVRADGEMAPYCGFHGDLLADMEACEQWESNNRDPGS